MGERAFLGERERPKKLNMYGRTRERTGREREREKEGDLDDVARAPAVCTCTVLLSVLNIV